MRHADRVSPLPRRARQTVVALVAVQLQDPVEAAQERLGVLAAPVGGIEEDHPGRVDPAPATIVTGQRPKKTRLGPTAPGIEDRRRGLVHEQLRGRLQVLGQPVDDRPQMEGGDAHPVRQGAAMDVNA